VVRQEVVVMVVVHCSIFFLAAATDRSAMQRMPVMANDVHGVFTWVAARGKAVLDG